MHVGGISSELHFKHLKTNVLPRYNPKPVIQPELDSCNNQATIKKYTHAHKKETFITHSTQSYGTVKNDN